MLRIARIFRLVKSAKGMRKLLSTLYWYVSFCMAGDNQDMSHAHALQFPVMLSCAIVLNRFVKSAERVGE